ncbi:HAMP domain-containing protein [Euzebya sp.]|uniref:HAMP domain-containing protein n=1 Tax=Euzebya sp. TaxID=1971409 RepID=UPI003510F0A6
MAALLVARRITLPLRTLATTVRRFGAGDPTARADARAAGEIGEVGAAFNRMADVLARRARQRRQFAATVAHELRTPIAVLQATVEAMIDGVEQPSSDAFAALHEQVLRLTRNVAVWSRCQRPKGPTSASPWPRPTWPTWQRTPRMRSTRCSPAVT